MRSGRSLEQGLGGPDRSGPLHPSTDSYTQLSLCNYTLPPLPSENTVTDSLHIARTHKQSRQSPTKERSENPLLSAQLNSPTFSGPVVITSPRIAAACPTRPRSSPLRLDPQASRLPLRLAQFAARFHSSSPVTPHITFPQTCRPRYTRPAPRRQERQ